MPGRHWSRGFEHDRGLDHADRRRDRSAVAARPILPKTLATSGNAQLLVHPLQHVRDASVIDMPGGAVGM